MVVLCAASSPGLARRVTAGEQHFCVVAPFFPLYIDFRLEDRGGKPRRKKTVSGNFHVADHLPRHRRLKTIRNHQDQVQPRLNMRMFTRRPKPAVAVQPPPVADSRASGAISDCAQPRLGKGHVDEGGVVADGVVSRDINARAVWDKAGRASTRFCNMVSVDGAWWINLVGTYIGSKQGLVDECTSDG